jgi:hypothetical protein
MNEENSYDSSYLFMVLPDMQSGRGSQPCSTHHSDRERGALQQQNIQGNYAHPLIQIFNSWVLSEIFYG